MVKFLRNAISFYSDMPNIKYISGVACQISFDLNKYNFDDKIVIVKIIVFSTLNLIETKEMLKNNIFDQSIKIYAKSEMEHLCIKDCKFKWEFNYVNVIDLNNIVLQKFDYEID